MTVLTFPKPANLRTDPNLTPRMKLMVEIENAGRKAYERDWLCDQVFLSAVNAIQFKKAESVGLAARTWGADDAGTKAIEHIADRNMQFELVQALGAWKREADRVAQGEDEGELAEAAE